MDIRWHHKLSINWLPVTPWGQGLKSFCFFCFFLVCFFCFYHLYPACRTLREWVSSGVWFNIITFDAITNYRKFLLLFTKNKPSHKNKSMQQEFSRSLHCFPSTGEQRLGQELQKPVVRQKQPCLLSGTEKKFLEFFGHFPNTSGASQTQMKFWNGADVFYESVGARVITINATHFCTFTLIHQEI